MPLDDRCEQVPPVDEDVVGTDGVESQRDEAPPVNDAQVDTDVQAAPVDTDVGGSKSDDTAKEVTRLVKEMFEESPMQKAKQMVHSRKFRE